LNNLEDGSFDYEDMVQKCCSEEFPYKIPFELRRYSKLKTYLYKRERDTLDLNNILNDGRGQQI